MAATQLGIGTAPVTRYNVGTSTYDHYYPVKRPENSIAATGKKFDFRIILAAYEADGVTVDTTFTGNVTATVNTIGFVTLGSLTSTPLTRAAVAGQIDFSDLIPATGTGDVTITFSGAGLTNYVTKTFTIVTPQYDAYALTLGIEIEKPRLTVDTSYPTSFSAEYTVDPASPVTATNFHHPQDAIDRIVIDNPSGDVRVTVQPGTYAGRQYTLKPKPAATGLICFEPAGGIPGTAGQRITAAEVLAAGVRFEYGTPTDLLSTIMCSGAAHHYRFSGIEIAKTIASNTEMHNAIVYLCNEQTTYTNALTIDDAPHHIGFDRCWIHGESGKTVRKGVLNEGGYNFVTNSIIDEIHATFSPDMGSGDENAICSVSATAPALYDNNHLRATGEVILFGGGSTPWVDLRNRDITCSRNFFDTPIEWKGVYKQKNSSELKNAERVWYWGNVHESTWDNNQDGMGLKYSSANQDYATAWWVNYQWQGIADIIVERCFARTMTGFLTITADANTGTGTPTTRTVVHDCLAVNMGAAAARYSASPVNYGILYGGGLTDCAIGHITMLGAAGDTYLNAVRLLGPNESASYPMNTTTYFRDNICVARGYGMIDSGGSLGKTAFAGALADESGAGNVFYDYTVGDGGMAGAHYPPTLNDVGIVDPTITDIWADADPDLVCAACALSASSPYRAGTGATTDNLDAGANIPALRAAIAGVWNGTAGSTPTQLLLSTPPAGAVSGMTLTTQPAGTVADSGGSTVTDDTSTVTASWVSVSGDATAGGTLTAPVVLGLWAFATLKLTWTVPSQGYWHFADGSLTGVDGPMQFLPTALLPSLAPAQL